MSTKRGKNVDPTWPEVTQDDQVMTEFTTDRQGSLSPFGDIEFPRTASELPYQHPTTIINR